MSHFTHLHNHSHYSLLECSSSVSALVNKAVENNQKAVALTDTSNMFGVIEFYFECKKRDIQPILGLEVCVSLDLQLDLSHPHRVGKLVILAQNYKGYQNLCQISTQAYKNLRYSSVPVDLPFLNLSELQDFSAHTLVLTGGFDGWLVQLGALEEKEKANEKFQYLKGVYSDRLYIEWNIHGLPYEKEFHPWAKQLSEDHRVPLAGSNNTYFLNQEDQIAQEILVCVGTNRTLEDDTRRTLGSDQFYFKSTDQMKTLFEKEPKVFSNTQEIVHRCQVEISTQNSQGKPVYYLPTFPTHQGRSEKEELKYLALLGLKNRFKELKSRGELNEDSLSDYYKRLDYELKIIDQMDFNGYFLIVQDFIKWAKDQDIPVGPGRGSGVGSLVAYSLKVTDLDPLRYNLVFERFLNPERISMPDFDIDFCQDRRSEVIKYVTDKYGVESVSQIITYGKLQTRAAIRDVGRILGFSFLEVNHICKLVPEKLGVTISESLEMEPRFQELFEQDSKIKTLMDLALKIEGLVRHAGIHAAGVIIADGKILDHAPLYIGTDGENVVQYDMKSAEKIGLIKFDFLGLKTLTHIQDTFELVKKNRGKEIHYAQISMNDPGIYKLMEKGDTAGVFQFEGRGFTSFIIKSRPTRFEDLVAITALCRPGPMEMIPEYLKRKRGEVSVKYIFEELRSILEETYGIIVYQEQVQLIAAKIANYSLGEADMLRRAMGKKIASEMEMQKERFLNGAKENGFDIKKTEDLFDLMAEFAKYGFNKSHAAAYSVISAQTAWLKHYYPVEFLSALLSTEMNNTDNVVRYSQDAIKKGIKIRPPSINESEYKFSASGDSIVFSLGAVKGVGESAAKDIIEARNSQPNKHFEGIFHFFDSISLRRINKKTINNLIKAGAFDEFGFERNQLLKGCPLFFGSQERKRKDKLLGQINLFKDMDMQEEQRVRLPSVVPLSKKELLSFEKDVLGFYLSGHILDGIECLVPEKTFIDEQTQKELIQWPGIISFQREVITKKGTRMAFLRLENQYESFEAIVFPDSFDKYKDFLELDTPLVFIGKLEKEDGEKKLVVYEVKSIFEEVNKKNHLILSFQSPPESSQWDELNDLVEKFPGRSEIYLKFNENTLGKEILIRPGVNKVKPDLEFIQKTKHIFPESTISFEMRAVT